MTEDDIQSRIGSEMTPVPTFPKIHKDKAFKAKFIISGNK